MSTNTKAEILNQAKAIEELNPSHDKARTDLVIESYAALMRTVISEYEAANDGQVPSSHYIVYMLGIKLGHNPQDLGNKEGK